MSPQNPNLADLNQRTSEMPLWEKYAFLNLMLADLSLQVSPEMWHASMNAGCKFGIGKVGPQLVEKVSS